MLIKLGAKLVVNAEDVIKELPYPGTHRPGKSRAPRSRATELAGLRRFGGSERKLYELLVVEETRHIDGLVENSGLNSSEVLATLFDLEMKGVVRQSPGKQFSKRML